jgi:hypothetical protein
MDLVRLGPAYSTSYQPDVLIEGYSSLIWTERFFDHGDFQLKTPNIEETMDLLPEDTLISHLDTDEVMIIENHEIDVDENENEELTITGRSLTSFLEHRFIEAPYRKKRKLRRSYSPTGAAAVLLYNSIDNASGKDVTRIEDTAWTTLDRIPNISITDSVVDDGDIRRWWVEEGSLWPQLLKIFQRSDMALRTIRPSSESSAQVMTVTANPLADRGITTRTYTTGITSLRFDLYDGIDRSDSQSDNPIVILSVIQGDLDKMKYLYSNQNYKTAVELMSSINIGDVYRNATEQGYSGLKRRTMTHDAGEPEVPDPPEKPQQLRKNATKEERDARADAMDKYLDDYAKWKNERDQIYAEFRDDHRDDALRVLRRARRVAQLAGDVSPYTPYQYKEHYNLGDTVSVYGKYKESQKMIVSEYIRTEDSEGDRGYPGLVLP